jgi:hypothetical protein
VEVIENLTCWSLTWGVRSWSHLAAWGSAGRNLGSLTTVNFITARLAAAGVTDTRATTFEYFPAEASGTFAA